MTWEFRFSVGGSRSGPCDCVWRGTYDYESGGDGYSVGRRFSLREDATVSVSQTRRTRDRPRTRTEAAATTVHALDCRVPCMHTERSDKSNALLDKRHLPIVRV